MKLSKDGGSIVGNKVTYKCDCLGISGGWTPMVHLFTQSGGKLKFRNNDNVFIPDENKTPSEQISVGSSNGDFELDDVINNTVKSIKIFLGLDKNMRDKYKDNPYFESCREFCEKYDQNSFDPDYDTLDLDFFIPMVKELFQKPKKSIYLQS